MNCYLKIRHATRLVLALGIASFLSMPLPSMSATVSLATSPLTTSTNISVLPNVLFILDDSGSMNWDYMPDPARNFNYYGLRSNQCNQVYYNPDFIYLPPLYPNGTSYPDASFSAAWVDGFSTGSGTTNLDNNFRAPDDGTGQRAYYYKYSGVQSSILEKDYNNTGSTFFKECDSSQGAAPGNGVFSKRRLSPNMDTTITITGSTASASPVISITVNGVELLNAATPGSVNPLTMASNIANEINLRTGISGFKAAASSNVVTIANGGSTISTNLTPQIKYLGGLTLTPEVFPDTDASALTNFANWYSYYSNRMRMMKTSAGRAFSILNKTYRVGLMKINDNSPVVPVNTFEDTGTLTQRTNWYNTLYGTTTNGSTPLREALANAGRYYSGKLGGADPMQYSCQQNFSILSTDGYWNGNAGFKVDGSTAVGNQDGTADRPMLDGAQTGTTDVTTYTRISYSTTSKGCGKNKRQIESQPELGTCSVTTVGGVSGALKCNWVNDGPSTTDGICLSKKDSKKAIPKPNPSNPVQVGSTVTTPGSAGGTSDTLSDVAMYYYQTDLRTPALNNCGTPVGTATVGPLCENNVFTSSTDTNTEQHMTLFTLGLGASGYMNYSSSYLSDSTGDFVSVKLGLTADSTTVPPTCSWQSNGSTCNWPTPNSNNPSTIDDLWHAAVNGRGAFFSATNPETLSTGISNALAGINARKGAAAAAATSTLNPVAGNNFAYVASYTTLKWTGNLEARGINIDTGVVNENAEWCLQDVPAGACAAPSSIVTDTGGATTSYYCSTPNSVICTNGILDGTDCLVHHATACSGTLPTMVSDYSDARRIFTADLTTGSSLVDFLYPNLDPAHFSAANIGTLSQWSFSAYTPAMKTAAEGANLVNYLRGQFSYEDRSTNVAGNRLYRYREAVLGDALESQPAFSGAPPFSYIYPDYLAFQTANLNRDKLIFMGANDGMMHAFYAENSAGAVLPCVIGATPGEYCGGEEAWAYVPSMVIPNMWKLADTNYSASHTNFVNGGPITADFYCTVDCGGTGGAASWRTMMVAGLNGGGRGYYAIDITDPVNPTLLWEFKPSSGAGSVGTKTITDDDLGFSFGSPVLARKTDGSWVVLVTSGYNNTSPGDGLGYLYVLDANSGTILNKISTGIGSTASPSGLAKFSVWNNAKGGNEIGYIYGGDLEGNVWRFDIYDPTSAAIGTGGVFKLAELYSDTAGLSPQPITTAPALGLVNKKRYIYVGTGKYLETSDLADNQQQTQYAIKDDDNTTTMVNPRNSLSQQVITVNAGGATRDFSAGTIISGSPGWYADLGSDGDRVNIDPKLVSGALVTASIVPSNTACSPGGTGWVNLFNYKTGQATSSRTDSPVVGINIMFIQDKPIISFVTAYHPTPEKYTGEGIPDTSSGFSGQRVIWRELIPN